MLNGCAFSVGDARANMDGVVNKAVPAIPRLINFLLIIVLSLAFSTPDLCLK